jgi:hypothetical protein
MVYLNHITLSGVLAFFGVERGRNEPSADVFAGLAPMIRLAHDDGSVAGGRLALADANFALSRISSPRLNGHAALLYLANLTGVAEAVRAPAATVIFVGLNGKLVGFVGLADPGAGQPPFAGIRFMPEDHGDDFRVNVVRRCRQPYVPKRV